MGTIVVIIGATSITAATASAFAGTAEHGTFTNAFASAVGLRDHIGPVAGAIFAIILFDGGIVGASAVTLATSYAFGDVFKRHHSLHRKFGEAKLFYGAFAAMVSVSAAIVLIPNAPLGLITVAVQALAGTLLPSASVFLVLLCNDSDVLGPYVNRPWLNVVATVIISVLLELSLILVVSTIFPSVDVATLAIVLTSLVAVAMVVATILILRNPPEVPRMSRLAKESWRMPALTLLHRPTWSLGRQIGILALRGYLVLAVLLLVVKAIQIAFQR